MSKNRNHRNGGDDQQQEGECKSSGGPPPSAAIAAEGRGAPQSVERRQVSRLVAAEFSECFAQAIVIHGASFPSS